MAAMRAKLGVAVLGVAVMMAACGQVPSASDSGGSASPTTVGAPLPLRAAGPLDWQVIPLPQTAYAARVDRQMITAVRIDPATVTDTGRDEVLTFRRADGQRLTGYGFTSSYQPLHWLVHGGELILVEQLPSTDHKFGLTVVDLASGQARPVSLRAVHDVLLDDPVVVRDEILVIGYPAASRDTCLVALRPPAYTERTVECGLSDRLTGLVPGPDGPLWTRDCQEWRQLLPDGSIRSLPVRAPICDVDSRHPVAVLPEGQLDQINQGLDQPQALVAGTPARTVGEVSNGTAVACGERVYWVAGIDGQRLMRWRPGADHAEFVLPAAPGAVIRPPHCVGGVLNIGMGPNTHRVPFTQFRVLDHP